MSNIHDMEFLQKKVQELKAEIENKKVTWSIVEKQDKYKFSRMCY